MRFEVLLNGETQCVAGLGEGTFHVKVFSRWPSEEEFSRASFVRPGTRPTIPGQPALDVTGLDGETVDERTYWVWLQRRLEMGDEVTIKVLEKGAVTPPIGSTLVRSKPRRRAASAFGTA